VLVVEDTIRIDVPEISRFFGIAIRFYYNDHEPAHFHAVYAEHEALIEIETLAVLRGLCQEGRLRSCSNGPSYIVQNCAPIGNELGLETCRPRLRR